MRLRIQNLLAVPNLDNELVRKVCDLFGEWPAIEKIRGLIL